MRHLLSARWRHEHRRALRMFLGGRGLPRPGSGSHRCRARPERRIWVRKPAGRPDLRQRHPAADQPVDQADRHQGGAARRHGRVPQRPHRFVRHQPQRPVPGRPDLERLHRLPDHHQPEDRHRSSSRSVPASAATTYIGDGTVAADGPLWSADGKIAVVPADLRPGPLQRGAGRHGVQPGHHPACTTINNLTTGPTTQPDLPSGMALSQDGSKLYVALNGVNELGVINTATNKLVQGHQGRQRPPPGRAGRQQRLRLQRGRPPGQARGVHQQLRRDQHRGQQGHRRRHHRHRVRGQPGHRQAGQGDPGRPGADGRVPGHGRHPHGGQLQRRQHLVHQHQDGNGRADRQRQPAAGLHRRQLPERDHDAQLQHDPGQHRPGQRPGRLRLQRADGRR